eukprot:TRINITY_DN3914_c0_g5_i4.p1 TRINITY_DN3914_c0_g5~~TRINITY_DN3914_c0_g5_i4.p1  ORF type:complete len:287 (-),score=61.50 TRINITY_DN3914_c0_g5_i4:290-1096(-)
MSRELDPLPQKAANRKKTQSDTGEADSLSEISSSSGNRSIFRLRLDTGSEKSCEDDPSAKAPISSRKITITKKNSFTVHYPSRSPRHGGIRRFKCAHKRVSGDYSIFGIYHMIVNPLAPKSDYFTRKLKRSKSVSNKVTKIPKKDSKDFVGVDFNVLLMCGAGTLSLHNLDDGEVLWSSTQAEIPRISPTCVSSCGACVVATFEKKVTIWKLEPEMTLTFISTLEAEWVVTRVNFGVNFIFAVGEYSTKTNSVPTLVINALQLPIWSN